MKIKPRQAHGKILEHARITHDIFRLRLLCPEIAAAAEAGQFAMLRMQEGNDPFLRRPFSFARILPHGTGAPRKIQPGILEFYYKVVGRGTKLMSRWTKGQSVELLGPLGRGFWPAKDCTRAILVGGGIGMAPLLGWGERLCRRMGPKPRNPGAASFEISFCLGGKKAGEILGYREFKKMGTNLQVATEDGSLGIPGLATDLLEREVAARGHQSTAIYACGPMGMLARVAQIAEQFGCPCQVLIEARMACGLGACLGCAVKIREEKKEELSSEGEHSTGSECGEGPIRPDRSPGVPQQSGNFRYARACREGPVFESREIFWE